MAFMKSSSSMSLLFVCLLLLHLLSAVKCQVEPTPALYVFGDSLVDSGNNNFLITQAKANYKPYGLDFAGGSTGRFTNGNTIVDFIAEYLKLPYAPAYLSLPESPGERSKIAMTGVNYASGSAGILPETGSKLGENLNLGKQISYFESTVKNDLPKLFRTPEEQPKYLAKSIFVISIGSNDYINNYLQPASYSSSKTTPPQPFADQLLDGLKQHLTTLYNLGARKFVVFGLAPIGCLPAIVNSVNPKPTTPCVEDVNNLIKLYNNGLPGAIQQLESSLQGSTFVHGDIYQTSYDQNQDPPKFGYTGGRTPCCVVGGNGTTTCLPNQTPCNDRDKHLYWDAFHPITQVDGAVAEGCFKGSSPCVPINILQLAQKQMALMMFSLSSSAISLFSVVCCLLLHQQFLLVVAVRIGQGPAVPALYVFGDSLVDSGNNDYLQTQAKANYKPYGIDFHNGTTGRFTNGKTVVDFIAKRLGLPYVPAYLGLSDDEKSNLTTGVNYASGAGGILPETGTATGDILALGVQINYFKKTVRNDLPKSFKTPQKLSKYLAKSIFVFSIGSNDYINNYLQPANYNSSKIYTPQQFGALLLDTLKQDLTTLYNLGARKFVVFELGPIGCIPALVNIVKPNTSCVEDVNNLIKIYNTGIPHMIQQLSSSFHGSTFLRGEIYKQIYDQEQNPSKYGFTAGRTPCCVLGGAYNLTCVPNQAPCEDRNTHLYWDASHPTQRANYKLANSCFRGSSPCVPINIRQLAKI
ncbi:Lipase [Macleaya cordata]|uniref:Lipase n=1 Tax=Macleaya cordata TaxID=56857 RepID=A0A200R2D7_MACCD|nr:Lipase [Macleaya cordata]